jgi:cytochrome b561
MSSPKTYSRALRIVHWLIAGVFLFIMLTIFLRQNWMNKDHIGMILRSELLKRNIELSGKEASLIGKSIRAPMWQWHTVAGYILLGLYLIRMIVLKVEGATFENPFKAGITGKDRLKSTIYLLFYLCFATSLLTGILIVWAKQWHDLHKIAVRIHILSMYYAVAFVVLHLEGLAFAELGKNKGIISRMIHGGS